MDKCPISGLPCSEQKIFHVTDIGDNHEVMVYHLCKQCGMPFFEQHMPKEPSKSQEQPKPEKSMFHDILTLLLYVLKSKSASQQPKLPTKKCTSCGFTLEDLAKMGRLGCPDCYDCFKQELTSILQRVQKSSITHVGKRPKHLLDRKPVEEQIKILDLQLREVIELEQYEKAQEIKTKLEQLKLAHGDAA